MWSRLPNPDCGPCCAEEQRQAILAVVFAKQAAGATPGSAQRATPNGLAGSGEAAAAADGHAEPAGEQTDADGLASGERQRQQAGSGDGGAGKETGVLEGVPPTLERQRNKRQRRKAAAATEED